MFLRLLLLVVVLGGGYLLITKYGYQTTDQVADTLPVVAERADAQASVRAYFKDRFRTSPSVYTLGTIHLDGTNFTAEWFYANDVTEERRVTVGQVTKDGVSNTIDYTFTTQEL